MYDGLEIDMLSVGCADCILVTKWNNGIANRVLVDGACKSDYENVIRPFLRSQNIVHLDAVVCSHPHDDHAAGLLELIRNRDFTIGSGFVHVPRWHVSAADIDAALAKTRGTKEADVIRKSLQTAADLVTELRKRGIEPVEPFAGLHIGCTFVLGPSQSFYEELIQEFVQPEQIMSVEKSRQDYENRVSSEERIAKAFGKEPEYGLLEDPDDTPENQSSVILWTRYGENAFILTADAGVKALSKVSKASEIANSYWMQIPHHGSRRHILNR
jgi:beta-lactamase superfamily II metal-dependent hydrolase